MVLNIGQTLFPILDDEMRESNNILRLITGLLGGVGLILVYEIMIDFFIFNFL